MGGADVQRDSPIEMNNVPTGQQVVLDLDIQPELAAQGPAHSTESKEESSIPQPEILSDFPLEGPYLSGPKSNGDHWEQCHMAVERYDNDMCKSWREEIDTLLVFAGLFTAIVTAFTVESYQWLQPDPADATNQLLLRLSQQMADSTLLPASDPVHEFVNPPYAIRINCFWFLSITLSLGAGVIGILCKQWMREFQRDAALPPKDALALRQLRYLGWKRWGVPHIISTPAILLQLSLLLFLAGIVDLLWSKIHCPPVAICATIVISLVAITMGSTTIAPFVCFLYLRRMQYKPITIPQCPFKSPQAYLFLRLWDLFNELMFATFHCRLHGHRFRTWLMVEREILDGPLAVCGVYSAWVQRARTGFCSMALHWVQSTLAFNGRVRDSLYHCFLDSRIRCERHRKNFHLHVPENDKECEMDRGPHGPDRILRFLYRGEAPVLAAEILLRDHLLESREESVYLFSELTPLHPSEVPDTVQKQALKYAQYSVKHREVQYSMWLWVLKMCRLPSQHDALLTGVLQNFQERLATETNSKKRFERCKDLIVALNLQDLENFVESIRERPVLEPLLTCLKKARYYLQQHDSESRLIRTVDEIIELFCERTSLHRSCFHAPQNDDRSEPPVWPQLDGDTVHLSPSNDGVS